jgi:hypothetical protein
MPKDMLQKEFEKREDDIKEALEALFEAQLSITEWDVPEADEPLAKRVLIQIFQDKLDEIKRAL